jgi:hypothetical protein
VLSLGKEEFPKEEVGNRYEGYWRGGDDIFVYKIRLYITNCAYLKNIIIHELH